MGFLAQMVKSLKLMQFIDLNHIYKKHDRMSLKD